MRLLEKVGNNWVLDEISLHQSITLAKSRSTVSIPFSNNHEYGTHSLALSFKGKNYSKLNLFLRVKS